MSENKQMRRWQLKYCQLAVLLVDDQSIDRGIIAPNGITPVLFFMIRCGKDPKLREWLTASDGSLKECNFIKLVAWLEGELYFSAKSKMDLICYLYESGEFEQIKTIESFKTIFFRKLPSNIENEIRQLIKS